MSDDLKGMSVTERADYWLTHVDGQASIEASIDYELVSDLRARITELEASNRERSYIIDALCEALGDAAHDVIDSGIWAALEATNE